MPLTQVSSRLIEDTLRYVLGASGTNHYTFTGKGLTGAVNDPTLTLSRGHTYVFENRNSNGAHPFYIKTSIANGGTNDAYNTGVTNNGGAGGTEIVFTVPHDAPDLLYYQCSSHSNMAGQLKIAGAVADGSITESKLADDAVTADKLANSINSAIAANTAKDLTALSASNLTSGTVPDARISASSVTQHVTAFDDNKILNDISTLALRQAAFQNKSAYNTNSMFVEVFQDETGVASKTNVTRNSTNEYMSSVSLSPKSYYKPNVDKWTFTQSSTGIGTNSALTVVFVMKSGNGTSWNYNGSQGGGIMNFKTTVSNQYVLFGVGNASNNTQFMTHSPGYSDNGANISAAPTDKWIWGVIRTSGSWLASNVDIMYRAYDDSSFTTLSDSNGGSNNAGIEAGGQGRLFRHDSSGYYGDYDNTHIAHMGLWNVKLSDSELNSLFNNGQTFDWTTSKNNYTSTSNLLEYFKMDEGSGTTLTNSGSGGNATKQSGSGSWDTDTAQIGISTGNATGNFISNVISASSSTSKIGVVITYTDAYGTATLNTDLKVYVSADNGSNFTQVTLAAQTDFSTGVKMAVANDVSVTAGTQIKYKVEFANQVAGSKETRVTGISLQF